MTTTTATADGGRDWRDRAACRYVDPDLMFPTGVDETGPRQLADTQQAAITQAKQVCGRCPVKDTCLQFALDTGQRWGIWGGLTAQERGRQPVVAATQRRPAVHVDDVRVARLIAGHWQPDLPTAELMMAAGQLFSAGVGTGSIARRLHVNTSTAAGLVGAYRRMANKVAA